MLKKIFLLVMIASVLISCFSYSTYATQDNTKNVNIVDFYLLGDVNGDKSITAIDARLALRASVGIINLDLKQFAAADINGNNEVEIGEARKILRIAVRIDNFMEQNVELNIGESCIISSLKSTGSGHYNWICEVSPSTGLEVTSSTVDPSNNTDVIGMPTETTYTLEAKETGVYTVNLKLIASEQSKPINEIIFTVTVTK